MHFESSRAASQRLFAVVDAAEVALVARTVAAAERMRVRGVAKAVTKLGNGGMYPLLTIALARTVDAPLRFVVSVAISLGLAFALYPLLKVMLARTRPCDYDRSLIGDAPAPLDHYSCPSGHSMTAAAYSVPLLFDSPAAAPMVLAGCAVMMWSRVALGHHYVTDVVLGAFLGATIATSVAAVLM